MTEHEMLAAQKRADAINPEEIAENINGDGGINTQDDENALQPQIVDEWANLEAHDLSLLPSMKSEESATETAIIFVNETESEITYYWIDYAGSEIFYNRLPAGASGNQHTFVGHVWLIKDHTGRNLALFKAKAEIGQVTIRTGSKRPAEDVNADGVVNIQDLVAVAAALGETAAGAPSILNLSAETVQQWLTVAEQLNLTDATSQRGVRFLAQLLLTLTPKETLLLAK